MNSTNLNQEVPIHVSTAHTTEPPEETERSQPSAPTTTSTVAGSAEHCITYTRTTRQQFDMRLRTRPEPSCKRDPIEPESQKSSPSKRFRTAFTPDQTTLLEMKYALNSKPSRETRLELAQELQL